jgi:hypothetical protein
MGQVRSNGRSRCGFALPQYVVGVRINRIGMKKKAIIYLTTDSENGKS